MEAMAQAATRLRTAGDWFMGRFIVSLLILVGLSVTVGGGGSGYRIAPTLLKLLGSGLKRFET
jgi:hypothetical protein